jgi:predicted nucleic acid-binding protein
LIDYLGGRETEITGRFAEILNLGHEVGLTSVVYQEVVQGVSSREEFDRTSEYLGSLRFYHPQDPVESYTEAARMYFDCRRAGVTIRSAMNCLIARIAIENGLLLLHDDRDFEKMAGVVPDLDLA